MTGLLTVTVRSDARLRTHPGCIAQVTAACELVVVDERGVTVMIYGPGEWVAAGHVDPAVPDDSPVPVPSLFEEDG